MLVRFFLALPLACCGVAAWAETRAGAFIDVSEDGGVAFILEPEFAVNHAFGNLAIEGLGHAAIAYALETDRLDDIQFGTKIKASINFSPTTKLVGDFSYDFDRDFDANFSTDFAVIDTTHRLSGYFSLDMMIEEARLTLDAGVSTLVHEDLQRIGFSVFDRAARDYFEPETAVRLAFFVNDAVHPFVEAAYVNRVYFEPSDTAGRQRGFSGPEILAGLEVETAAVSAQIAAIHAWRDHDETGVGDRSIFGPYVDVSWRPDTNSEVIFAVASSLVQDSSGAVSVYPVHSMHLEGKTEVNDALGLGAGVDIKFEDFSGPGGTLTVLPEFSATWRFRDNFAVIAAVGGEWVKDAGAEGAFTASARIGIQLGLQSLR